MIILIMLKGYIGNSEEDGLEEAELREKGEF